MLIRNAARLAPANMRVELLDIGDIPLYNADIDKDDVRPSSVVRLKELVDRADGLLISTPEYNHSVPGVLQNAIDWASRPAMSSPLRGKPVGIMGVSMGAIGAARATQQLKLVLQATLAHVMPHAGVSIGMVQNKVDSAGLLVDEASRTFLESFLQELFEYAMLFDSGKARSKSAA
jgi:chromate reductase